MPESQTPYRARLALILVFAVAMAYFEAALVVYLRELFYPEGFRFPLKELPPKLVLIELGRELSTIVMLGAVAALAGRSRWERFGYFLIVFGVWDIFYYVWLKATINWPLALNDWDVLFLIPLPWIGPVIAPCLIALQMTVCGLMITRRFVAGGTFRATPLALGLSSLGTAVILWSFMADLDATLSFALPQPYAYWALAAGMACYAAGFAHAWRRN